MKYMGSKRRIAKEILPIILENRKPGQYYVEPFVGGFNMIEHVDGPRIGNDCHFYLIELFRALQLGYVPPSIVSEDFYYDAKKYPENYLPEVVGFVGFCCSYSGKWFGGYARGEGRNYADEGKRNLLKQVPKIKGIILFNELFYNLQIPRNSIIYCDPPYQGTTQYNGDGVDHEFFWEWCRVLAGNGHQVFVSEYQAPDDFECIWAKEINNTLVKKTGSKKGIEKLFIYKGRLIV